MSGATQDFMKVMMMGVVTTAVYLTTIWISKGKAQLPVSTFLQSDQVYWRVFAREMHSTSQFDKTILSKSVCVCVSVVPLVFPADAALDVAQVWRLHMLRGRNRKEG